MRKIKIMQLIHGFSMGGAETLVKDYCLNIGKSRFEIVALCFDNENTAYDSILKENGVRVIYINNGRRCKNKFEYFVRIIKNYIGVKRIIAREAPDIIHSHLPLNSYVLFASPRRGTKIIHTVHSEPKKVWNNSLKRKTDFKAAKKLVRKYKMRFIALHENMAREINWMFGVTDTVVVNNGIDFSKFSNPRPSDDVRGEIGIPKDSFVVGHVGRFVGSKNHLFLLDVFKEVCRKKNNSHLLLIGNGALKEEIQGKIKSLDLSDKVTMLKNRTDIPDLMNSMDVFCFPSIYEGLGITMIEAQKTGVPCVISDTITKSVTVSNIVTRLSLNDSAEKWADVIVNQTNDNIEYYDIDDWDIKNVVKRLEDIYEGKI